MRAHSAHVLSRTMVVALVVALVLPLAAACRDPMPSDRAGRVSIDTLPGGAVRVSNPESGVWEADGWRLVEELRIGVPEGPEQETFGRIAGLDVDELDRIWVIDIQAREVRVFDSSGRYVRTVGRAGSGPGEFSRPVAVLRHPGGHLWVVDPGAQRYSVFDTSGALVRTVRRVVSPATAPRPEGFDPDGMLMEVEGTFLDGELSTYLLRIDSTGVPLDTLPLPRFEEEQFEVLTDAGGGGVARYASRVPFTPYLEWRVDARGRLWQGVTSPYRFVQQAPEGDTLRVVERRFRPIPVQPEERSRALESLEGMRRMGARIDASRIPPEKVGFESFFFDDGDHLWVQPVVAGVDVSDGTLLHTFDVFDPEGIYLGRLRSPVVLTTNPAPPGRLMPVVRGGDMYGVHVDELGVQYVVKLRIQGR